MNGELMPSAVYTIWWATLIVVVVVAVPIAVFLLHSTWRAARSIELYAREALEAAGGIAANTAHVKALDATHEAGAGLLRTAGAVASKLETAADALSARAESGRGD